MPIARFEMPDGRIGRFEVPEGTTPEQAQKMISDSLSLQEEKDSRLTPEQVAAPARKPLDTSLTWQEKLAQYILPSGGLPQSVVDIAGGASSTMRGASKQLGLGEGIWPTSAVDKESLAYLGGQIADPVAMAIGAGGMKAAQLAGALPRIGAAIAKRPVVSGMLGGGLGGVGVGALGEDTGAAETGLFGAAIGGAFPVAAKAAGTIADVFKPGQITGLRAKKILEDVAGEKLAAIRAAWKQAPTGLTAAQAAAGAGSTTLAALGERATRNVSQYYDDLARAQAAARRAEVAGVAGGQSQAEAAAAAERAKASLGMVTTPMRETELGAVREAGQKFSQLSGEAERMEGAATSKVEDVRRFDAARQRADELAKMAEKVTDKAAKDSLLYGEAGRFARMQLESLDAHGLRPLDTDSLISKISSALTIPEMAGNRPSELALSAVSKEIKKWTERGGGVIDPAALYAIRKNAVNSAIDRFMGSSSDEAKKRAAAGIMKSIKPHFDDAIEKAGGTGWRDYLKTYEEGMNVVNRMKLGGRAMQMLDDNPEEFVKLVRNNKPDVVNKIFTTEDDIAKAMAEKYAPLNKAASEIERDAELAARAVAGKTELAAILAKDASSIWLPQFINWKIAAARKAGDVVEEKLNAKTMNRVYAAMKSGKDAEAVMNLIPAKERNMFLSAIYTGKVTPYTMGGAQAATGQQQ